MRKTKLNICLFLITTVLLSVMTVMAATKLTVTIDSPAADGKLYSSSESTANVSVTVAGQAGGACSFNCTVFAKSSLSANSTWTLVINGTASAIRNASDTVWNATFNTAMIEDANDYIINATCFNGTAGDHGEDTNTGITIDNTAPTAATSLYPTGTVTNQTFRFGGTVTDSETTSCTIRFDGTNPGLSSYTGTYSGSSCYYAATLVPEQTYKYYVRASDGTNTTDSSVSTVTVDVDTAAGKSMTSQQIAEAKAKGLLAAGWQIGDTTIPTWAIVIAIIAIIGTIWYIKK